MNSPQRFIHDLRDGILRLAGRKHRGVDHVPASHLIHERVVQTKGSCAFDNPLEAACHQRPVSQFTYEWDEVRLHDLREVYLVGDQAQIFFSDGSFFLPCIYPHQSRLARIRVRRPWPLLAKRAAGIFFHLTGRNHENKGHFLLQHLPRLLVAREYLRNLPDHQILVAPGHARWQRPFLRLAGVPAERVVECGQGTLLAERVIHVPMVYGSNALGPPEHYREICARAGELASRLPQTEARPIFISRRDAPDKRLLNEDEILNIAQSLVPGMERFEFKGKTLEDQVAAFRRAPLIMGPIGQGLCNIVFATGQTLITLAPGTEDLEVYKSGHGTQLAILCGNQAATFYNGIPGESRGDWHFPPARFRALLERLLSLPGQAHLANRKAVS